MLLLQNLKISILSTTVPREMIRFLEKDHPTLYRVLS